MAETAEKKQNNHFLRILSAVLIMFVVIVHYQPVIIVGDYNIVDVIQSVGRFAMPVFFMISGYFLYSSDGHSEKRLGVKAKRTFILIVFIKFFYLALDIIMCAFGHGDSSKILWNFLVIGDTTAHYWFIATLLTIYLGHWIFYKKHWDFKYLIPLGVILLLIDMIIGEGLPLCGIDTIFGMKIGDVAALTYVTIGLFFFQVGYYLHKHHDWVEANLKTSKLVWLMILGMVLNVVELFLILNTHIYDNTASSGPNVYIGTIVFAIPMFILTFRIGEDTFRWRSMEWLGTYVSSYMYAFIGFGICLLQQVFLVPYVNDLFIYQILGPALAIMIDVAMALLMYFILKAFSRERRKQRQCDRMRFSEYVNEMKHPLAVLLIVGLIIRLILSPLLTFNIDMGYWTQVIDVFQNGFGLYGTAGYYYTPVWGYYLGFVSGFMQLFGITDYGQFVSELEHLVNSDFCVSSFVTSIQFNLIVKLPLILVDVVISLLVYRFVNDRTGSRNKALLAFALLFFCPLVITESSVHGTFDNLSVMFLLLSVILMFERKYFLAGAAFGIAVLTKFFPLFMIFFMIAYVLRKEGVNDKGMRKLLEAIAGAVVVFVLIYLPNIIRGDFWQSFYFLAYRIGISRETLASISPTMSVLIVGLFLFLILLITFIVSKYGPKFTEKMNSLDEVKRNKDAAKWIAVVMAVVLIIVAIVSIIKTDSLEGGAFKLVLLVCVFSLFLEIYLAFRLLMLKEIDDKNVITLLYLSAMAIIYWPCAISYTLIFIPFVCIFIAMVDERYKRPFIIFAVLATLCEITAYLLSPTSLFMQTGIGIGPLLPLYDFMADPWILGMNGATILTAIFEIPAYIVMLYLSFKFYWERKKEGRLWTED